MGCDIHAYAEIKRDFHDIEAWYCCEKFQLNPYIVSLGKLSTATEEDFEELYMLSNIYRGRDYNLFEALAGVRGLEENALFEVKYSIPDDCSEFIRKEYEAFRCDAHTPSYITLKELFSVDSMVTIKEKGYVSPEHAKAFKEKGVIPPNVWPNAFSTRTEYVEFSVEVDPLEKFKKAYLDSFKEEFYMRYATDKEIYERIMKDGDKYRIVFWFDN